jgi:Icc-related predicted phosphoesterase
MAEGMVASDAGAKTVLRIAAVGDLHCKLSSLGKLAPLFSNIIDHADVLLICGDLTDYGLPEEARVLTAELGDLVKRIPTISVLGNHDLESGKQMELWRIFSDSGFILLDGNSYEICGVGFTGVKGFAGGFDKRALQAWGEDAVKEFVREAKQEAMKLESSLAKLGSNGRIVLLHYAPIRATVVGESPEIYPFLGSSHLEEALNRHPVDAVFHGHSHAGSPEGRTSKNIPVYNVALPLMRRVFSDVAPYRIFEMVTQTRNCSLPRNQLEDADNLHH